MDSLKICSYLIENLKFIGWYRYILYLIVRVGRIVRDHRRLSYLLLPNIYSYYSGHHCALSSQIEKTLECHDKKGKWFILDCVGFNFRWFVINKSTKVRDYRTLNLPSGVYCIEQSLCALSVINWNKLNKNDTIG